HCALRTLGSGSLLQHLSCVQCCPCQLACPGPFTSCGEPVRSSGVALRQRAPKLWLALGWCQFENVRGIEPGSSCQRGILSRKRVECFHVHEPRLRAEAAQHHFRGVGWAALQCLCQTPQELDLGLSNGSCRG